MDALVAKMRLCGGFGNAATELVLHLAPSAYLLRLVSDRCLGCFLPAYFLEHMKKARQIDGAGLRLDAEFKLAKKVRSHDMQCSESSKKRKLQSPFKCTLACRGVRGLYLAPLTPCETWETGDAYVEFLLPILRDRRASCEHDVAQGMPRFVSFDNGPASALYALAAVGEIWPQAVYGSSSPPCESPKTSRLHVSLRRNAVAVVSDPPHRRWHCQKMLSSDHPDYWLFDQCLAYAVANISAPAPAIARALQKTDAHGRGFDEDEQFRRKMAPCTESLTLKKLLVGTSVCAKERLTSLLRSHDVTTHGFLKRVFGSCPPNKVLCMWSEALDVDPHPILAMTKYEATDEFVSDIRRIVKWFAVQRLPGRVLTRKPTEEASAATASRTSGPLLGASAKKTVLDIINEPLLSSLMQCGDVHRLFAEIGLRVPTRFLRHELCAFREKSTIRQPLHFQKALYADDSAAQFCCSSFTGDSLSAQQR